ncbi:molybdenum cofactor guanylyltransferase [Romboutsia sp.]|uniref:molybdenum cofactor guanylyltransferase n=1 Tax=Romboutsia sp. TaxID=1965302 RepID=UPI003F3C38C9
MNNTRSAIILAGGKSSRMGFDKQFIEIREKRLICEIGKNLEKYFDDIVIVTNKREYYEDSKYKIVSDKIKGMGPLAGIAVGLNESISKFVYIIACDMPNIDERYIKYLKNKVENDINVNKECDVYISKLNNKIEPFQGFYKKELGNEINNYLKTSDKKSIISFFERNNKRIYYLEDIKFIKNHFNYNMFININTEMDLELYKREIGI